MKFLNILKKHWKLITLLTVLILLVGGSVIGVGIYANDFYRADGTALNAMDTDRVIAVAETTDGMVFLPEEAKAGFIFYPGGKVEYTAYAPLMNALAERGILCVLVDMPLNLAVLDMNAADGIAAKFPDVERWAIGGHSLGGAMAANYAAKHGDEIDALVLLAAYSTAALPETLDVISVYGSQDGVLDMEKYAQYRENLPVTAIETVLEGGNHAQFGSYGPQAGDGIATLPTYEQVRLTVEAILPILTGE